MRTGPISGRQSLPTASLRAASLGQMLGCAARRSNRSRIICSMCRSRVLIPRLRQASEQYLMRSQSRAHLRRQEILRPQTVQMRSMRIMLSTNCWVMVSKVRGSA